MYAYIYNIGIYSMYIRIIYASRWHHATANNFDVAINTRYEHVHGI